MNPAAQHITTNILQNFLKNDSPNIGAEILHKIKTVNVNEVILYSITLLFLLFLVYWYRSLYGNKIKKWLT